MKRKKPIGVCKLTGRRGELVKAHIIPRALTKPEVSGNFFIETGHGLRPSRQSDSWYDDQLVILRGEKIFATLDNWAIKAMRAKQLVWSGWNSKTLQSSDHEPIAGTPHGFRTIEDTEISRLRLFVLSILWRAAASSRPEWNEVDLPPDDVTKLGTMLIENDAGPYTFYPVQLFQLSTKGPHHNMGPLIRTTVLPATEGHPEYRVRHFRFYFDGLIIHIHARPIDDEATKSLGSLILGAHDRFGVVTVTSEASLQAKLLDRAMLEAQRDWPGVMRRLVRSARSP